MWKNILGWAHPAGVSGGLGTAPQVSPSRRLAQAHTLLEVRHAWE